MSMCALAQDAKKFLLFLAEINVNIWDITAGVTERFVTLGFRAWNSQNFSFYLKIVYQISPLSLFWINNYHKKNV